MERTVPKTVGFLLDELEKAKPSLECYVVPPALTIWAVDKVESVGFTSGNVRLPSRPPDFLCHEQSHPKGSLSFAVNIRDTGMEGRSEEGMTVAELIQELNEQYQNRWPDIDWDAFRALPLVCLYEDDQYVFDVVDAYTFSYDPDRRDPVSPPPFFELALEVRA